MLQKAFDIHSGNTAKYRLCMEVGDAHIVLTAFDENGNAGRHLEYYLFYPNENFEDVLPQIFEQSILLKHDFDHIRIVWENPRAAFVPSVFHKNNIDDSVYKLIDNSLNKQQKLLVKNDVFLLPYLADENKWSLLHKAFPKAADTHKYAEILNRISPIENNNTLHFITLFYPKHFIVAAHKNNQIQLINSVPFSSAQDVVYFLLNGAKRLNTSISETLVTLSGLLDGDSDLFKKMYNYLPNIDVDTAGNAAFLKEGFGEYPSHFFVPFFKYV